MMNVYVRPFGLLLVLSAILSTAAFAGGNNVQPRVEVAPGTEGMLVSETPEAKRINRDVLSESVTPGATAPTEFFQGPAVGHDQATPRTGFLTGD